MHTTHPHSSKLKSYLIVAVVALVTVALIQRAPAKIKAFVFPASS